MAAVQDSPNSTVEAFDGLAHVTQDLITTTITNYLVEHPDATATLVREALCGALPLAQRSADMGDPGPAAHRLLGAERVAGEKLEAAKAEGPARRRRPGRPPASGRDPRLATTGG